MSSKSIRSCLAAWAFVLLIGALASAQGLQDMQLFAPADLSTYGGNVPPREGFFFSFEGLVWAVSRPNVSEIGHPTTTGRTVWYSGDEADTATQFNTHNTGVLGATVVTGQRYELGFIHGHQGLLVSAWHLSPQTQTTYTGPMDMVFDDREWGGAEDHLHLQGYVDEALTIIRNLPVTFETAEIRNRLEAWGVEVEYLIRSRPTHNGGYFEFFAGARYLELNDHFGVDAFGAEVDAGDDDDDDDDDTTIEYEGTLANSYWRQTANNHVVGPQIGLRWFKRYGRWTLSTEGRFFAGYNMQAIHQSGVLGTELDPPGGQGLPLAMGPTAFNHTDYANEWTPGVELRLMAEWQWTKNVSFGAGWNGMWLDNIARASSMIDYKLDTASAMGIIMRNNRQDIFVNGFVFKLNINR
ncbi:MAG: BBP7 family outer membrane beta-barrel protein [Pirellulales bacterium]|nr:BBP7 family outer membrane beta-barrel protein [Pirellulales bacterium]